jgi:hypothetical protein
MTVKIWVAEDLDLPEEALFQLAQAVRDKFELEPEAPVYPEDLLIEAARQEIISGLPAEEWKMDDEWVDPLTPEEIGELAEGPEESTEESPSCPHCGAEVAPDDRACPDCGGTVYGNL